MLTKEHHHVLKIIYMLGDDAMRQAAKEGVWPPRIEVLLEVIEDCRRTGRIEDSTCKRCGQPLLRIDDPWFHKDSLLKRGCRAASYVEGVWDDSLHRRWLATPVR